MVQRLFILFALPLLLLTAPAFAQVVDTDLDGVEDAVDLCADSVVPETEVPTRHLNPNRCVVNPGPDFTCGAPKGKGNGKAPLVFTMAETFGCTCEQIIVAQELGKGHLKFGCSRGAINAWIEENTPAPPE